MVSGRPIHFPLNLIFPLFQAFFWQFSAKDTFQISHCPHCQIVTLYSIEITPVLHFWPFCYIFFGQLVITVTRGLVTHTFAGVTIAAGG